MDIKIVDEKGQETPKPEPVNVTPPNGLDAPINMGEQAVADIMGIERNEMGKYGDKIALLLRFAKQQDPQASPEKIKWIVRDLDMRLGTAPMAQRRIDYVARVAYLRMQKQSIDNELTAHQELQ